MAVGLYERGFVNFLQCLFVLFQLLVGVGAVPLQGVADGVDGEKQLLRFQRLLQSALVIAVLFELQDGLRAGVQLLFLPAGPSGEAQQGCEHEGQGQARQRHCGQPLLADRHAQRCVQQQQAAVFYSFERKTKSHVDGSGQQAADEGYGEEQACFLVRLPQAAEQGAQYQGAHQQQQQQTCQSRFAGQPQVTIVWVHAQVVDVFKTGRTAATISGKGYAPVAGPYAQQRGVAGHTPGFLPYVQAFVGISLGFIGRRSRSRKRQAAEAGQPAAQRAGEAAVLAAGQGQGAGQGNARQRQHECCFYLLLQRHAQPLVAEGGEQAECQQHNGEGQPGGAGLRQDECIASQQQGQPGCYFPASAAAEKAVQGPGHEQHNQRAKKVAVAAKASGGVYARDLPGEDFVVLGDAHEALQGEGQRQRTGNEQALPGGLRQQLQHEQQQCEVQAVACNKKNTLGYVLCLRCGQQLQQPEEAAAQRQQRCGPARQRPGFLPEKKGSSSGHACQGQRQHAYGHKRFAGLLLVDEEGTEEQQQQEGAVEVKCTGCCLFLLVGCHRLIRCFFWRHLPLQNMLWRLLLPAVFKKTLFIAVFRCLFQQNTSVA